ncbi:MAG: hypothetical protein JWP69_725 [Flaviaesturariibacter sp.]|nr:hypothetical protein [Flaviaesturariibacter sp.]
MSKNRLFFIQQHLTDTFTHGGVGFKDAERVLVSLNFKPLVFPQPNSYSIYAKLVRFGFLLRWLTTLPTNAVIVFIHPLHSQLSNWLVKCISQYRKSITVACFIGDIEGLRDGDRELLTKEKAFWLHFEKFIVHNTSMKQWLQSELYNKTIVMCEFFDFLAATVQEVRKKKDIVAFAGNFDKAQFIWQLPNVSTNTIFKLYGNSKSNAFVGFRNVLFKGVYQPENLPFVIEGSFGLVWDGMSMDKMYGYHGAYNKYNSPHKLSLYIISSLPIICHHDAAAAELIKKYNIGFTVGALDEISNKIENISEEAYVQMQQNCRALAVKITSGGCLTGALKELGVIK